MASTYGENIKLSIFGQSHSAAIGAVIDGLPAGFLIDTDKLREFMMRRAPGRNRFSTPRKEADEVEFLSGLVNGTTCGAPLAFLIRNTNVRKQDYANLADVPRPAHADYTAHVKYGGFEDSTGGGHFSGRLTAPLAVAGGIAKQYLEDAGIQVSAEIQEIGGNREDPFSEIDRAREAGDSVGGIIFCTVTGVPAGIGAPMFGGME
ncbi:MAG: chorismate synthase, partial [Eubacteriales bacterium]|nr:chorismate synthase [Eubacteriales bacterium]